MRAIIIPLNEFFYNYKKYDGYNPFEGFINRRKWLYYFTRNWLGYRIFLAILIFPSVLMAFLFFFGPVYLYHYLLKGHRAGIRKIDIIFNAMNRWIERTTRKDIQSIVGYIKDRNFDILVYYTKDMIPTSVKKRTKFFSKIESMKMGLAVFHIFEANSKNDVEDVIRKFNIDPDQSFFMSDGNIDLGGYSRLINHFDGSF